MRIKEMVRIRDERIIQVEKDLRKITDEYRKLREEVLPLVKMAKDRSQPLPPTGTNGMGQNFGQMGNKGYQKPPAIVTENHKTSGLSRSASKRNVVFGGPPPSNPSPTQISIEASPAALAASNHLTSSMAGPKQHATLPSPTSPNTQPNSAPIPRSFPNPPGSAGRSKFLNTDREGDLTVNDARQSRRQPAISQHYANGTAMANTASSTPEPPNSAGLQNSSSPSVEIFKSFRVSMDDPCHKVLPAALRQYKIEADWRTYALYIVYGDEERCLGMEEKPLTLFKQLMHEGRKPMFMLRKVGSTENEPLTAPGFGQNNSGLQPLGGRQMYGSNANTASSVPGGII
jgi:hypothetical protein